MEWSSVVNYWNKLLDFDSHLDPHADYPIEKLAITQQVMTGF